MSRPSRNAVLWAGAVILAIAVLVEVAAARGGGRGGGGRGGFSGGGMAARGSFGQRGMHRGDYDARGPAADGSFAYEYGRDDDRQERRHERREERREDWQDYADDGYVGDYYEDDYGYYEEDEDYAEDDGGDDGEYDDEGVVYLRLPCKPAIVSQGGTAYYVCDSVWYVRAFSNGELVYVEVPAPE